MPTFDVTKCNCQTTQVFGETIHDLTCSMFDNLQMNGEMRTPVPSVAECITPTQYEMVLIGETFAENGELYTKESQRWSIRVATDARVTFYTTDVVLTAGVK